MSEKKRPSESSSNSSSSGKKIKGDDMEKTLHCMRCHQTYKQSENLNNACVIEHDAESFEGSRNGTNYYTGYLQCCGAFHKFHRHTSEDETETEFCYSGPHTSAADEVKYNNWTVTTCTRERCGESLKQIAEASKTKAKELKKSKKENWKQKQRDEWAKKRQTLIDNNASESALRRLAREEKALRCYIEPTNDTVISSDDGFCSYEDILDMSDSSITFEEPAW